MDDFEKRELLLAFTHRGRKVQLHASAKGWAALFLRDKPWTARHHIGRVDYEHRALAQGQIAVNPILRDLVKAQITAVESGMLSFEAVFMPHMLTADGQPLIDRVQELLPRPDEPKVVPMISHKS